MKTTLKILLVILSIMGLYATFRIVMAEISSKRLVKVYECNCRDVKTGMAIKEAMQIMQRGLDSDYRGFTNEVTFSGNEPYELFLEYSVHKNKFIVTIHYDKNTGQVTRISCPVKQCAN